MFEFPEKTNCFLCLQENVVVFFSLLGCPFHIAILTITKQCQFRWPVFKCIYCFFPKHTTAHQRKTLAIEYYVWLSSCPFSSEAPAVKFFLCSEGWRRCSERRLKSMAAKQLTRLISVVKSKAELWLQVASIHGIFEGMVLQRSESAIIGFP